jgi:hypothetical protein
VTATSVHPVLEYMAFLVSLSSDTKIANILDHLIKTAGPFGFSERKANSAERVIYHIAMNVVAKTQGEPLKIEKLKKLLLMLFKQCIQIFVLIFPRQKKDGMFILMRCNIQIFLNLLPLLKSLF